MCDSAQRVIANRQEDEKEGAGLERLPARASSGTRNISMIEVYTSWFEDPGAYSVILARQKRL